MLPLSIFNGPSTFKCLLYEDSCKAVVGYLICRQQPQLLHCRALRCMRSVSKCALRTVAMLFDVCCPVNKLGE